MDFNTHSRLEGAHAFLGASKYHWINYDEDKLAQSYLNWRSVQRGTELHEFAAQAIRLGVKLSRSRRTLNMYVNDAIGFQLSPEQVLYYSDNCFGTADAIGFKNNFLRIHDLKTGETKASFHQLEIYEAIFCLEYDKDPTKIDAEHRIYQYDEVHVNVPNPDDILEIMDKIIVFDKRIEKLKMEE